MTFVLKLVHTDKQTRYHWLVWYIIYQVRQYYTQHMTYDNGKVVNYYVCFHYFPTLSH